MKSPEIAPARQAMMPFLLTVLCGLAWELTPLQAQQTTPEASAITSQQLLEDIEAIRKESRLVAVGCCVLVDGQIVAQAATGKRKQSTEVFVTVADQWHHGSITKSITATVFAHLVEEGKADYQSKLFDLVPELAEQCHEDWNSVTLHHLLTHQSGLPANFPMKVKLMWPQSEQATRLARKHAVIEMLKQPPESEPGKKYRYSNVGYTVVGMVTEELTNETWEELVRSHVFRSLKLQSAGFGPPTSGPELQQPWGHSRVFLMRNPMNPSEKADNTPVMGPAGIVHMSMADLAKYGWAHLRAELPKPDSNPKASSTSSNANRSRRLTVSDEAIRRLHQPARQNYAYGWVRRHHKGIDGEILWHNGSNTMWVSSLTLIPSRKAVVVLVTNDGLLEEAGKQFDDLTTKIVRQLDRK